MLVEMEMLRTEGKYKTGETYEVDAQRAAAWEAAGVAQRPGAKPERRSSGLKTRRPAAAEPSPTDDQEV